MKWLIVRSWKACRIWCHPYTGLERIIHSPDVPRYRHEEKWHFCNLPALTGTPIFNNCKLECWVVPQHIIAHRPRREKHREIQKKKYSSSVTFIWQRNVTACVQVRLTASFRCTKDRRKEETLERDERNRGKRGHLGWKKYLNNKRNNSKLRTVKEASWWLWSVKCSLLFLLP